MVGDARLRRPLLRSLGDRDRLALAARPGYGDGTPAPSMGELARRRHGRSEESSRPVVAAGGHATRRTGASSSGERAGVAGVAARAFLTSSAANARPSSSSAKRPPKREGRARSRRTISSSASTEPAEAGASSMTRSPSEKGAGETKPTPLSEMSVTWIATGVPGAQVDALHDAAGEPHRDRAPRRDPLGRGHRLGEQPPDDDVAHARPGRASLQRTIARRAPSRMK